VRELDIPSDRRGVVVKDVVGLAPGIDVLAHGDVIVEVNRAPTPHETEYRKVLSSLEDGQTAWLFVYRPRPEATFLAKVEVEKKKKKAPAAAAHQGDRRHDPGGAHR